MPAIEKARKNAPTGSTRRTIDEECSRLGGRAGPKKEKKRKSRILSESLQLFVEQARHSGALGTEYLPGRLVPNTMVQLEC